GSTCLEPKVVGPCKA
nr:RecName: Full=PI-stichotoxin-Hcr2l; Short=PI-SHTX-Hcr2l; AltName: Full=Kunitz-type serine protease inhibitor RmIn II [Heteractis crispa]